jgi:hypothetical protein
LIQSSDISSSISLTTPSLINANINNISTLTTQKGSTLNGTERYKNFGNSISLSSQGNILAVGSPSTENVNIYEFVSGAWTQKGSTLNRATGNTASYFGGSVSLSSDGLILAVGAPYANSDTGYVEIYEFVSGAWTQKGSTLNGTANSYFGYSVSLSSDGLILAVGAQNANSGTGYVNIYEFVSGEWTQKGSTLNGTAGSYFGYSVSLSSDGLILAVGAPYANSNTGYVEIYEFVSGAWTQKGSRLNGTEGIYFGWSVSLSSDGLILAVGTPYANSSTGYVKIYEFVSGAWTQKGSTLDGNAFSDFGTSVSLSSDGLILAVGAPSANSNTGYVNIYESVYSWTPKGSTLNGNAGSYFGNSVSLSSDGLILAVGAPDANNATGYVEIYEFVSGAWTQKGSTLNGTANSYFGYSVSLSSDGLILAVGAPYATSNTGYVEIYEFVSGAWTQKGSTLDGTAGSRFGWSVSLSSDGLILAVGAPIANSNTGYVEIYEFVSGAWTQKGSRLNGNAGSYFGYSVSLSSDGLILAVGAQNANNGTGYVEIYEFVSGAWTQKGSRLNGNAGSYFGNSVSLSSDGLILAVGAPYANSNTGSVEIYEFVSGAWTQKGSRLNGTEGSYFGWSVSLSSDGLILAVGAPYANSSTGYVKIYEFVSGAWTQKGSTLDGTAGIYFGYSVSLSSDGLILVVGAPDANNTGNVNIYEFFDGDWSLKGSTLNGNAGSYFGNSVSLSSDGLILAVGAPNANSNTGYVEIYEFVSGAWTQKGSTLNGTEGSYFGWSVSLSSDGLILAVGAPNANSNTGYVEIYEFVSGAWTQKGSTLNGNANSYFGYSVSLSSDGLILAVGTPYANSSTGYVKIYEFVSGAWTQKGSTLDGTAGSYFGYSVSLSSDGLILVVGAPVANSNTGYVEIYEFVSGAWTQKGSRLNGTAGSRFGDNVSLSSDGLILAVGAPYSNTFTGYVKIYEFVSGAWTQKGSTLNGNADSQFGTSVSLSSDGLILAVGAPSANNTGNVEIYEFVSEAWTIKGSTLDGTAGSYFGYSVSLSSDGLILVVGAPESNNYTGYVKAYSFSIIFPSNPVIGQIFFSSDLNKLYIWNGASWKSVVFTS